MCERNINQPPVTCLQPETWPIAQARALTGDPTSDFLVCRPGLSPLSHSSQGSFWILSHLKAGSLISDISKC